MSEKIPFKYMAPRVRLLAARHWTVEREAARLRDDEERLQEVEQGAQNDNVVWNGTTYVPDTYDRDRHFILPWA